MKLLAPHALTQMNQAWWLVMNVSLNDVDPFLGGPRNLNMCHGHNGHMPDIKHLAHFSLWWLLLVASALFCMFHCILCCATILSRCLLGSALILSHLCTSFYYHVTSSSLGSGHVLNYGWLCWNVASILFNGRTTRDEEKELTRWTQLKLCKNK